MSRVAHKLFFTALSAIVIAVAPAAAQAADTDLAKPGAATGKSWTTLLDLDLSRDELGLPQRASAARVLDAGC